MKHGSTLQTLIFSRIVTIFFSGVRFGLLYRTVRRKYDDDIRKSLQYVNNKCYIGDWFVLYQARKNSTKCIVLTS